MIKYKLLHVSTILLSITFAAHAADVSSQVIYYDKAVARASMHNLYPVSLLKLPVDKQYVQMVTWTNKSYPQGQQILTDNICVTQKNELQKACKNFPGKLASNEIEQLLGMPPLSHYKDWHFEVMQVPNRQAALDINNHFTPGIFRPCFSTNSIHATYCTYRYNMKSSNYDAWLLNLSLTQFRVKAGYPWTGLGYTYNWNPKAKSVAGLSEFIVTQGTSVRVVKSESPDKFCFKQV